MATYTQTTFFTPKDSLTSGDPSKKVLGSEFDVEFSNISSAVNSSFGSDSVATTSQAQALTLNNVLITPQKLREALEGPTQDLDPIFTSLVVDTNDITITAGDLNVTAGGITVTGLTNLAGPMGVAGPALFSDAVTVATSMDVTGGVVSVARPLTNDRTFIEFRDKDDGYARRADIQLKQNGDGFRLRTASGAFGAETYKVQLAADHATGVVNFPETPTVASNELVSSFDGRFGDITGQNDDYTIANTDDSAAAYPVARAERNYLSDADKVVLDSSLTTSDVIGDLSDVDTTTAAPVTGDYLQFDGTDWTPAIPVLGTASASYSGYIDSTDSAFLFSTENYNTIPSSVAVIDNTGDFGAGWTLTATVDCAINLHGDINARVTSSDGGVKSYSLQYIVAVDAVDQTWAEAQNAQLAIGRLSHTRRLVDGYATQADDEMDDTPSARVGLSVVLAAGAVLTVHEDLTSSGNYIFKEMSTPADLNLTVSPLTVG